MSYLLPPWVSWAFYLVGQPWPQGDEDHAWQAAGYFHEAASGLRSVTNAFDDAAATITSGERGQAGDAVTAFLAQLRQAIEPLAQAADQLGDQADKFGTDLQYTKISMTGQLVWLLGEIGSAIASAPFTFGLSMLSIPAMIAAVRVAWLSILKQLLMAVAYGAGMMFGIDLATQLLQLAMGSRHALDGMQMVSSLEMGALGGVLGGVANMVGEVVVRDAMNSVVTRGIAGGVSGVATTAAMNAINGQPQTLESLLLGGLGGGVAGGAGRYSPRENPLGIPAVAERLGQFNLPAESGALERPLPLLPTESPAAAVPVTESRVTEGPAIAPSASRSSAGSEIPLEMPPRVSAPVSDAIGIQPEIPVPTDSRGLGRQEIPRELSSPAGVPVSSGLSAPAGRSDAFLGSVRDSAPQLNKWSIAQLRDQMANHLLRDATGDRSLAGLVGTHYDQAVALIRNGRASDELMSATLAHTYDVNVTVRDEHGLITHQAGSSDALPVEVTAPARPATESMPMPAATAGVQTESFGAQRPSTETPPASVAAESPSRPAAMETPSRPVATEPPPVPVAVESPSRPDEWTGRHRAAWEQARTELNQLYGRKVVEAVKVDKVVDRAEQVLADTIDGPTGRALSPSTKSLVQEMLGRTVRRAADHLAPDGQPLDLARLVSTVEPVRSALPGWVRLASRLDPVLTSAHRELDTAYDAWRGEGRTLPPSILDMLRERITRDVVGPLRRLVDEHGLAPLTGDQRSAVLGHARAVHDALARELPGTLVLEDSLRRVAVATVREEAVRWAETAGHDLKRIDLEAVIATHTAKLRELAWDHLGDRSPAALSPAEWDALGDHLRSERTSLVHKLPGEFTLARWRQLADRRLRAEVGTLLREVVGEPEFALPGELLDAVVVTRGAVERFVADTVRASLARVEARFWRDYPSDGEGGNGGADMVPPALDNEITALRDGFAETVARDFQFDIRATTAMIDGAHDFAGLAEPVALRDDTRTQMADDYRTALATRYHELVNADDVGKWLANERKTEDAFTAATRPEPAAEPTAQGSHAQEPSGHEPDGHESPVSDIQGHRPPAPESHVPDPTTQPTHRPDDAVTGSAPRHVDIAEFMPRRAESPPEGVLVPPLLLMRDGVLGLGKIEQLRGTTVTALDVNPDIGRQSLVDLVTEGLPDHVRQPVLDNLNHMIDRHGVVGTLERMMAGTRARLNNDVVQLRVVPVRAIAAEHGETALGGQPLTVPTFVDVDQAGTNRGLTVGATGVSPVAIMPTLVMASDVSTTAAAVSFPVSMGLLNVGSKRTGFDLDAKLTVTVNDFSKTTDVPAFVRVQYPTAALHDGLGAGPPQRVVDPTGIESANWTVEDINGVSAALHSQLGQLPAEIETAVTPALSGRFRDARVKGDAWSFLYAGADSGMVRVKIGGQWGYAAVRIERPRWDTVQRLGVSDLPVIVFVGQGRLVVHTGAATSSAEGRLGLGPSLGLPAGVSVSATLSGSTGSSNSLSHEMNTHGQEFHLMELNEPSVQFLLSGEFLIRTDLSVPGVMVSESTVPGHVVVRVPAAEADTFEAALTGRVLAPMPPPTMPLPQVPDLAAKGLATPHSNRGFDAILPESRRLLTALIDRLNARGVEVTEDERVAAEQALDVGLTTPTVLGLLSPVRHAGQPVPFWLAGTRYEIVVKGQFGTPTYLRPVADVTLRLITENRQMNNMKEGQSSVRSAGLDVNTGVTIPVVGLSAGVGAGFSARKTDTLVTGVGDGGHSTMILSYTGPGHLWSEDATLTLTVRATSGEYSARPIGPGAPSATAGVAPVDGLTTTVRAVLHTAVPDEPVEAAPVESLRPGEFRLPMGTATPDEIRGVAELGRAINDALVTSWRRAGLSPRDLPEVVADAGWLRDRMRTLLAGGTVPLFAAPVGARIDHAAPVVWLSATFADPLLRHVGENHSSQTLYSSYSFIEDTRITTQQRGGTAQVRALVGKAIVGKNHIESNTEARNITSKSLGMVANEGTHLLVGSDIRFEVRVETAVAGWGRDRVATHSATVAVADGVRFWIQDSRARELGLLPDVHSPVGLPPGFLPPHVAQGQGMGAVRIHGIVAGARELASSVLTAFEPILANLRPRDRQEAAAALTTAFSPPAEVALFRRALGVGYTRRIPVADVTGAPKIYEVRVRVVPNRDAAVYVGPHEGPTGHDLRLHDRRIDAHELREGATAELDIFASGGAVPGGGGTGGLTASRQRAANWAAFDATRRVNAVRRDGPNAIFEMPFHYRIAIFERTDRPQVVNWATGGMLPHRVRRVPVPSELAAVAGVIRLVAPERSLVPALVPATAVNTVVGAITTEPLPPPRGVVDVGRDTVVVDIFGDVGPMAVDLLRYAIDPAHPTVGARRGPTSTAADQLRHLFTGDLVGAFLREVMAGDYGTTVVENGTVFTVLRKLSAKLSLTNGRLVSVDPLAHTQNRDVLTMDTDAGSALQGMGAVGVGSVTWGPAPPAPGGESVTLGASGRAAPASSSLIWSLEQDVLARDGQHYVYRFDAVYDLTVSAKRQNAVVDAVHTALPSALRSLGVRTEFPPVYTRVSVNDSVLVALPESEARRLGLPLPATVEPGPAPGQVMDGTSGHEHEISVPPRRHGHSRLSTVDRMVAAWPGATAVPTRDQHAALLVQRRRAVLVAEENSLFEAVLVSAWPPGFRDASQLRSAAADLVRERPDAYQDLLGERDVQDAANALAASQELPRDLAPRVLADLLGVRLSVVAENGRVTTFGPPDGAEVVLPRVADRYYASHRLDGSIDVVHLPQAAAPPRPVLDVPRLPPIGELDASGALQVSLSHESWGARLNDVDKARLARFAAGVAARARRDLVAAARLPVIEVVVRTGTDRMSLERWNPDATSILANLKKLIDHELRRYGDVAPTVSADAFLVVARPAGLPAGSPNVIEVDFSIAAGTAVPPSSESAPVRGADTFFEGWLVHRDEQGAVRIDPDVIMAVDELAHPIAMETFRGDPLLVEVTAYGHQPGSTEGDGVIERRAGGIRQLLRQQVARHQSLLREQSVALAAEPQPVTWRFGRLTGEPPRHGEQVLSIGAVVSVRDAPPTTEPPAADAVERVAELAVLHETTTPTRVDRADIVEVLGAPEPGRVVRPVDVTYKQRVRYDVRLLMPQHGLAVREFTVPLHLAPADGVSEAEVARLRETVSEGVRTAFHGRRLPSGALLDVRVDFHQLPSRQAVSITVRGGGSVASGGQWPVAITGIAVAAEIGRLLGLRTQFSAEGATPTLMTHGSPVGVVTDAQLALLEGDVMRTQQRHRPADWPPMSLRSRVAPMRHVPFPVVAEAPPPNYGMAVRDDRPPDYTEIGTTELLSTAPDELAAEVTFPLRAVVLDAEQEQTLFAFARSFAVVAIRRHEAGQWPPRIEIVATGHDGATIPSETETLRRLRTNEVRNRFTVYLRHAISDWSGLGTGASSVLGNLIVVTRVPGWTAPVAGGSSGAVTVTAHLVPEHEADVPPLIAPDPVARAAATVRLDGGWETVDAANGFRPTPQTLVALDRLAHRIAAAEVDAVNPAWLDIVLHQQDDNSRRQLARAVEFVALRAEVHRDLLVRRAGLEQRQVGTRRTFRTPYIQGPPTPGLHASISLHEPPPVTYEGLRYVFQAGSTAPDLMELARGVAAAAVRRHLNGERPPVVEVIWLNHADPAVGARQAEVAQAVVNQLGTYVTSAAVQLGYRTESRFPHITVLLGEGNMDRWPDRLPDESVGIRVDYPGEFTSRPEIWDDGTVVAHLADVMPNESINGYPTHPNVASIRTIDDVAHHVALMLVDSRTSPTMVITARGPDQRAQADYVRDIVARRIEVNVAAQLRRLMRTTGRLPGEIDIASIRPIMDVDPTAVWSSGPDVGVRIDVLPALDDGAMARDAATWPGATHDPGTRDAGTRMVISDSPPSGPRDPFEPLPSGSGVLMELDHSPPPMVTLPESAWAELRHEVHPVRVARDQVADERGPVEAFRDGRPVNLLGHVYQMRIRYDQRMIEVPSRHWIWEFTIPIRLTAAAGVSDLEVAIVRNIVHRGVRGAFEGYRIGSGRQQWHVRVDFDVNDDHDPTTVVVEPVGYRTNQLHWAADLTDWEAAHELAHFMGLPDEYLRPQEASDGSTGNLMAHNGHGPIPRLTAAQLDDIELIALEHIPVSEFDPSDSDSE